jgi:plasmid stabilization system protein ParE
LGHAAQILNQSTFGSSDSLDRAIPESALQTIVKGPGRIHGTRELVIHENYLAIYRVRADDVEILRIHQVARKL